MVGPIFTSTTRDLPVMAAPRAAEHLRSRLLGQEHGGVGEVADDQQATGVALLVAALLRDHLDAVEPELACVMSGPCTQV